MILRSPWTAFNKICNLKHVRQNQLQFLCKSNGFENSDWFLTLKPIKSRMIHLRGYFDGKILGHEHDKTRMTSDKLLESNLTDVIFNSIFYSMFDAKFLNKPRTQIFTFVPWPRNEQSAQIVLFLKTNIPEWFEWQVL